MADNLGAALVNLRIALVEPLAALRQPLHREMSGIALELRRVRQTVEVPAIEADLADLGLGFFHEFQVVRVPVFRPVGDHARELDALAFLLFGAGSQPDDREKRDENRERNESPTHSDSIITCSAAF